MKYIDRIDSIIVTMKEADAWWVDNRVLVNLAKSGLMGVHAMLVNNYIRHANMATANFVITDDQLAAERMREAQAIAFLNEFMGRLAVINKTSEVNAKDQVDFYWKFAFDPTAPFTADEQEKVQLIALMENKSEDEIEALMRIEKELNGVAAKPYKGELVKRTKSVLQFDATMVFEPTDMQALRIAQKLQKYVQGKQAYMSANIHSQSLFIARQWVTASFIYKTLCTLDHDDVGILDVLVQELANVVEAAREEQDAAVDHGGRADTASHDFIAPEDVDKLPEEVAGLDGSPAE